MFSLSSNRNNGPLSFEPGSEDQINYLRHAGSPMQLRNAINVRTQEDTNFTPPPMGVNPLLQTAASRAGTGSGYPDSQLISKAGVNGMPPLYSLAPPGGSGRTLRSLYGSSHALPPDAAYPEPY